MRALWIGLSVLYGVWTPVFGANASIESFSPEGIAKGVRQVKARFSEPMVAFGDLRQTAPFEFKCGEGGAARWVDPELWVLDFKSELPAGVGCEFRVRSGLKSVAGNPVGDRKFEFSTGGPAVLRTQPYAGSEHIAEDQAFVLNLDAAPDTASLEKFVYFEVEGIAERVGVRVIEGKDRRGVLKAAYYGADKGQERVVVVQGRQGFPKKAKVSLVWGAGVKSQSGVATAHPQQFDFIVRDTFRADFSCERSKTDAACSPFSQMMVRFSAPVEKSVVEKTVLKGPNGTVKKAESWGEGSDFVDGMRFSPPFPESTGFTLELPKGLKDDTDRPLSNGEQFPLDVKTDKFPPLAKFAASFGIIESKVGGVLPVTVRHLEPEIKASLLKMGPKTAAGKVGAYFGDVKGVSSKVAGDRVGDIREWLYRSSRSWEGRSIFESGVEGTAPKSELKPFRVERKNGAKAFEVIGIPLKDPGFYVVELESPELGAALLNDDRSFHVATSVLVTNLGVHFKWGREASVAWVTQLDTGKPVAGAEVKVWDCKNRRLAVATSDDKGIARLGTLPESSKVPHCGRINNYSPYDYGLLVTAEVRGDMAFVHTEWQRGIEPWRFQLPSESHGFPIAAHAVLDRSLLRAGETVHMKIFSRRQTGNGLEAIEEKDKWPQLRIEHDGSGQKYPIALKWEGVGTAEAQWSIPKEAKLGTYQLSLTPGRKDSRWISIGSFRVEEFRIPLMRALLNVPSEIPVAPKQISLTAAVNYLSGGPASGLGVKARTKFQPSSFSSAAFEGYSFANGDVKEEKRRRSYEDEDTEPAKPFADAKTRVIELDKLGTAQIIVEEFPKSDVPIGLYSELEFADPNGEIQTISQTTRILPSGVLIGMKADTWRGVGRELKVEAAAVDTKGKPLGGVSVQVDAYRRQTLSHRKRILGGYYAYEHYTEVTRLGEFCRGKTDPRGRFACEAKSPVAGNIILRAVAADEKGRPSYANQDVWVPGNDDWWFDPGNNDRMDVLAEKPKYEAGETAKFQVRMPFRQATALVSVEREGVLETYVQELSGKEPVIEVPIKRNYAPNVFVSVLALRGRVGDPKPTGLVDLGKPAYKLGIAEIRVGYKSHELKVAVKADREVYKVREKVKVDVKVTSAGGGKLPSEAEVVIAAVDEGLLELSPNRTWNLLDAMMGRRGYLVSTSTAQMHIIGKRHYGLKAVPSGGGGGLGAAGGTTRELFDTLLLWKAKVKLSPSGEAKVEVPLNDSLTSFRIVAVASAGVDQFGTGETSVRTSQDLMVLPGIPPLARSGDRLHVGVQLRNTTKRKMSVRLSASVLASPGKADSLPAQSVDLGPEEAREVGWEYTVPSIRGELRYTVHAAGAHSTSDSVSVVQKIVDAVPVRAIQATIVQASGPVEIPVELPAGADRERGGVEVRLSPSLVQGLGGVKEYMGQYPYSCLEQQVSRAVALRDRKLWDATMAKLPSYLDGHGFAKYFPSSNEGSEILSAYVVSIAAAAKWPLPSGSEDRLLSALESFVEGRVTLYSPLVTSDRTPRKVAALEALASNGKKIPKAALFAGLEGGEMLWPTSTLIDWVRALRQVEPGGDRLKKGLAQLRARVALQGTTLAFSTEKTDGLWWLMASADVNAVRALHTLVDDPSWRKEAPRLATGAVGRLRSGHWDLTTANAWGVLALEKFGDSFEKNSVAGSTHVALDGKGASVDWKGGPPQAKHFPWPGKRETLSVKHAGAGAPWVSLLSLAALPLKEPLWAGYRIEKKVTPVEKKVKDRWSRGDLARISVKVTGQSPMTWVVVNDPIPAGSAVLGTGLGRDSSLATAGEKTTGVWATVAFEERSFEGFRRYLEYLPEGDYQFEYTVRLNNPGQFQLPPTRVEAMYAPEMFGELPNANWEVGP